ncbi:DUF192 domain-containing protein [Ramlibacter albus]|uniref:DUF192 domain-containing protein n=1 Tax=Ramlibacter albus TaxID=2079448 RepID=A0A923M6S8_9BURK|nr:DUF192 domain-containing protein [Ramlibacter albus]MBC5763854.1 DUF192 domain-containing protein [Ramlibacter albus]
MKNLPRAVLTLGEHRLNAYVARGAKERAVGLMHVRELADDEGMLFVCGEPQPQSFWMKDTPLPLSIAFIDGDGTILQIEDMEAHTRETTESEVPVRYVLEVPRGWFAERGIGPGACLTGPVFVDAVVEGAGEASSPGA